MTAPRCPGQDSRYWKPEDIAELRCPSCGGPVEIWKDEPARACPKCGTMVRNPKVDPACAQWCPRAKDCLPGLPPLPRDEV